MSAYAPVRMFPPVPSLSFGPFFFHISTTHRHLSFFTFAHALQQIDRASHSRNFLHLFFPFPLFSPLQHKPQKTNGNYLSLLILLSLLVGRETLIQSSSLPFSSPSLLSQVTRLELRLGTWTSTWSEYRRDGRMANSHGLLAFAFALC